MMIWGIPATHRRMPKELPEMDQRGNVCEDSRLRNRPACSGGKIESLTCSLGVMTDGACNYLV